MSLEEFNTIVGLAAVRGLDFEAASVQFGKALSGDVRSLKDVTTLTKDQADALTKLKDGAERAALASEILERQYGGVIGSLDKTFLAQARLTNGWGDLQQTAGQVLNQSGAMDVVFTALADVVADLSGYVEENAEAIQELALGAVSTAVTWLQNLLDITLGVAKGYVDFRTGLKAGEIGLSAFGVAVTKGAAQLVKYVTDGIAPVAESIASMAELAAEAQRALGSPLTAAFEKGAAAARGLSDSIQDVGAAAGDSVAVAEAGLKKLGEELGGVIEGARADKAALDAIGDSISVGLGKAQASITAAAGRIEPLNKGLKEGEENAKKLVEAVAPLAPSIAAASKASKASSGLALELLAIENKLLDAQVARDGAAEVELTRQQAILEARAAYEASEMDAVALAERALALRRAEVEAAYSLRDAERAAASERQKAAEVQRQAAAESIDATLQTAEAARAEAGATRDAYIEYAEAGATAALDLAGNFLDATRAKAALQAAFYAAEAIGLASTGNIPGAIAAGAAAAQHGLVAAGVVGGGGGGGGAAPAAAVAPQRDDTDQLQRRQARLNAEALSGGGASSIQITIDQRGSYQLGRDPKANQDVVDALKRPLAALMRRSA